MQARGTCLLSLSRDAVPAEFAAHNKSGQGSGSGFVVTSDGYVVACAHVVEGSTKIEVALGGQNYPGQVVQPATSSWGQSAATWLPLKSVMSFKPCKRPALRRSPR